MFVFVVIAMTVAITNGETLCANANNQTVNCSGQGYTTIPELPQGVITV